jgi:hypothetical protein
MTVYVLTENEPNQGGAPVGVYSAIEKATAASANAHPHPTGSTNAIYPVELDAPQDENIDYIRPDR